MLLLGINSLFIFCKTNDIFFTMETISFFFLFKGCMLCFGQSAYFRFNHPEEALRMKSMIPHEGGVRTGNFNLCAGNVVPVFVFVTLVLPCRGICLYSHPAELDALLVYLFIKKSQHLCVLC